MTTTPATTTLQWTDPLAMSPDERAATLEDRYATAKAIAAAGSNGDDEAQA